MGFFVCVCGSRDVSKDLSVGDLLEHFHEILKISGTCPMIHYAELDPCRFIIMADFGGSF